MRIAWPVTRVPSQTGLLTHSDRDVIVPVVLGYEGHHWPVLGGVGGVDRDKLLRVILGQPVHPDAVADSVGEQEHFHLEGRASECAQGKRERRALT